MVRLMQLRAADSGTVRLICLAVHQLQRQLRLPATQERIVAHIIEKYQHFFRLVDGSDSNSSGTQLLTASFIEGQLKLAKLDQLVQLVRHTPAGGGLEVMCYVVPAEFALSSPDQQSSHDWYCFDCHGSGEVVACDNCHRVYHPHCLPDSTTYLETKFLLCPACDLLQRPVARRLKRNALQTKATQLKNGTTKLNNNLNAEASDPDRIIVVNTVVTIIVAKLEQSFADLKNLEPTQSRPTLSAGDSKDVAFEKKIYDRLVFESFDLAKISRKARYQRYTCLEEFRLDLQTVVHTALVFYGKHCIQYARKCDDMLEAARSEIHLADLCPQCYRNRHEAPANWFCLPCRPPHSLVYAVYRPPLPEGSNDTATTYFPAKVMRRHVKQKQVEVVYFGGAHDMAKIPVALTTNANDPTINCPPPPASNASATLGGGGKTTRNAFVNGTGSSSLVADEWQRAVDELERYRRKLASSSAYSPTMNGGGKRLRGNDDTHTSPLRGGGNGGVPVDMAVQTDEIDDADSKVKNVGGGGGKPANMTKEQIQAKVREATEREKGKCEKQMASEMKRMREEQDRTVSDCKKQLDKLEKSFVEKELAIKSQQWCRNCWKPAIYHCCWNNSYCSQECQQKHWYSEHKKLCKRKTQQQNQSASSGATGNSTPASQRA